ncbi:MAG: chromosomal replication initiator protein DnaA [Symbiobacteriaceae bacterium]|nr:chromosomal replication initiator protein DnaA [Symbiobacteriaceae bacterium]
MNAIDPLWQSVLERLKYRMQRPNYSAFILSLVPLELTDTTITLQSLDRVMRDVVVGNYGGIIAETLQEICGYPIKVEIVAPETPPSAEAVYSAATQGSSARALPVRPLTMESTFVDPPLRSDYNLSEASPHSGAVTLNHRYSFERFVRGKSNELPLAAALAVAEAPAKIYNPLFIYGEVGLGKTHLMQAIGLSLQQRYPQYRILYISFEKFLNDFISSLQNNTTAAFRNRYRGIDLLLIDDIQFIENKDGTQMEFFHTFNDLYNTQKQIVIASDRPPREIPKLTDRIRSRFEAGLIVDIQRPDLETRMAILQSKARDEQISVASEVYAYIATRVTSNIRELEGALMRLKAKAGVDGVTLITLDYAAQALKEIIDMGKVHLITTELIQQVVAGFYQVSIEDLKAKRRSHDITLPRQVAMYFCRGLTDQSLPKIGSAFGGRDHTTVIHAEKKISDMRQVDPQLHNQLNEIQRLIQA